MDNYKINVEYEEENLDDSILIIPKNEKILQVDKAVYLEGVAQDIWQGIKKGHDVCKITNDLIREYDVDTEELKDDIKSTIEQFCKLGLIKNN